MTQPTPCSQCGNHPGIILREYSGRIVCKGCFNREIENQVRREMARSRMLGPEDKLAFALSGGKDSVALMRIVSKIDAGLLDQQRARGLAPVAITIDEGIHDYREESIAIAAGECERLGIQHVVFSFQQEFGHSLDEMVALAGTGEIFQDLQEKHPSGQLKNAYKIIAKPCSICGVLRRRVLNDVAAGLGATKLATGHHLNDEIETFLINLFKGDVNRMSRVASTTSDDEDSGPFVKKIKPLQSIMQKDIVLYMYYTGGEFQDMPCPYAVDNVFRGEARHMIASLEGQHPGTLYNIRKVMETVYPLLARSPEMSSLSTCPSCGSLKSKDLATCMPCFYVQRTCRKEYAQAMQDFLARFS
jgi:uncharacterized protein (TIGR00269 family)